VHPFRPRIDLPGRRFSGKRWEFEVIGIAKDVRFADLSP